MLLSGVISVAGLPPGVQETTSYLLLHPVTWACSSSEERGTLQSQQECPREVTEPACRAAQVSAPCQLSHLFPKPPSLWSPAHVLIPSIPTPPIHPAINFSSILVFALPPSLFPSPPSLSAPSLCISPIFSKLTCCPHCHRVHHAVPSSTP